MKKSRTVSVRAALLLGHQRQCAVPFPGIPECLYCASTGGDEVTVDVGRADKNGGKLGVGPVAMMMA